MYYIRNKSSHQKFLYQSPPSTIDFGTEPEYEWRSFPSVANSITILAKEQEKFFDLVNAGDVLEMKRWLSQKIPFKINTTTNKKGESVFHIAILNENEDMLRFLLTLPQLKVTDAALAAIELGSMRCLEVVLEQQSAMDQELSTGSTVTPIIKAAISGDYHMLELLLKLGYTVQALHDPKCVCSQCLAESRMASDLDYKVLQCQALSSPLYLLLTQDDPLLHAFYLSDSLQRFAQIHCALRDHFASMARRLNDFAAEFIGLCECSDEVLTVLHQQEGVSAYFRESPLPRLHVAIRYQQLQFVAHPYIQMALRQVWHSGVMPSCCLWSSPRMLLVWHAMWYILFLFLLFLQSNQELNCTSRGLPNTDLILLIMGFVFIYMWYSLRLFALQRLEYLQLWNLFEAVMEILFLLALLLWLLAEYSVFHFGNRHLERSNWDPFEPTFLAESVFSVATTMAYLRLFWFLQLHPAIGPCLISVNMLNQVRLKFAVLIFVLILSFTAGLGHFYNYYKDMVYTDPKSLEKMKQPKTFTSTEDTAKMAHLNMCCMSLVFVFNLSVSILVLIVFYRSDRVLMKTLHPHLHIILTILFESVVMYLLLWTMFSIPSDDPYDLVITNDGEGREKKLQFKNVHIITQTVGALLFTVYVVIIVIVFFNTLIAMMSVYFGNFAVSIDQLWIFSRTQVYLQYIFKAVTPVMCTRSLSVCSSSALLYKDSQGFLFEDVELKAKCENKFTYVMSQLGRRYLKNQKKKNPR